MEDIATSITTNCTKATHTHTQKHCRINLRLFTKRASQLCTCSLNMYMILYMERRQEINERQRERIETS